MEAADLRIKSPRTPYRRAGIDFNSASWTELVAADVGQEQVGKLLADTNLTIQVRRRPHDPWQTLPPEARGLVQPAPAVQAGDGQADSEVADLREAHERALEANGALHRQLVAAEAQVTELQARVDQLTTELAEAKAAAPTDTSSQTAGSVGDPAGASAPAGEPEDASGEPTTTADGENAGDGQKAGGKGKGGGKAKTS